MAAPATTSATSSSSTRVIALVVCVGTLVVGAAVWFYTLMQGNGAPAHALPVWVGVKRVTAQLADGRMLAMKVQLRVSNHEDEAELSAHVPAFAALIEASGGELERDEVTGQKGMRHLGAHIEEAINDYLEDRGLSQRVSQVAFEEMTLLP